MCGICGTAQFGSDRKVDLQTLAAMNLRIAHRGPDDEGAFIEGNLGLAMKRLSIVDLETGRQPLSNEDRTICIVYNGEIYNHIALRRDLEARGHRYRSHSDTETIVHLYEEYGRDCVQHLHGMFAFALWDGPRQKLFAARDRLGIKPLYYYHDGHRFVFGSEIKALLEHPAVPRALNRAALPEFLAFGFLSGDETLFEGICKLPPGHTLELDDSAKLIISPYWKLEATREAHTLSRNQCVQKYRELLEQAVTSHLMSDVPLGMFLSGGLDSSVIAALATRVRKQPIQTFSVGYAEAAHSELPHARIVAQHLRSEHHEVIVSRDDFLHALSTVIWHQDEPPAWPSSVALYFAAKLAAQQVKVVLTGEGSDETLGGYARYPWTVWNVRADKVYRRLVPSMVREWLRHQISAMGAAPRRRFEHTFMGRDGSSWQSLYFDNFYTTFSAEEQTQLLRGEFHQDIGNIYTPMMAVWESTSGGLLQRMLATDLRTYLTELLTKQDRMSMAASIESRVPYLDHTLVEFALGIPSRFNLRGLSGKRILKEIAADLLPPSIIQRPKAGFPTPWSDWLMPQSLCLFEQLLTEARSRERGLFRPDEVRRLFAEHQAQQRDNSARLWRLLTLELWLRIFIDREPDVSLPRASAMWIAQ